jgi:hypothetical protein
MLGGLNARPTAGILVDRPERANEGRGAQDL